MKRRSFASICNNSPAIHRWGQISRNTYITQPRSVKQASTGLGSEPKDRQLIVCGTASPVFVTQPCQDVTDFVPIDISFTLLLMYLLTVIAKTTEQHPDYAIVDEAYVSCWIERDTEEQAVARAHEMILADGWKIQRTEEVSMVSDADYDEADDDRQYFEQALIDETVLVFHTSPRFSVYHMNFKITPNMDGNHATEARVWVANESVMDDHDPYDLDFWSGSRVERAVSLASNALSDNGYTAAELLDQYPCSRDETSEDCQFFDDAEEDGMCLLFVHD
jgi:hypothetical protein